MIALFTAATMPSASGPAVITASYNGASKTAMLSITASPTSVANSAHLTGLTCAPKVLTASAKGKCKIAVDQLEDSSGSDIQVSSSGSALRLPGRVVTRGGQRTVEFEIEGATPGEDVEVSATLGDQTIQDAITVRPDRSKPIQVPGRQFVRYGTELRFPVSTADSSATVTTGELPVGATFDSAINEFRWTPVSSQIGTHEVRFTAIHSTGENVAASVSVQVESGEPIVTRIVNAASRSPQLACGAGAIAAVEGRWLTGDSSKLRVNGNIVPILSASATELTFLCPDAIAGSDIQIAVETERGMAAPIQTTARVAAPGLFTVDGSGAGQALILEANTNRVAMVQNARLAARPARRGDPLLIYATGVDHLTNAAVRIGELQVTPTAILAVPNQPGVFQVAVTLPAGLDANTDVPLRLSGVASDGFSVRTNVVTIAVEGDFR
jgi:uncharacterized protein (TIGR03437 family)